MNMSNRNQKSWMIYGAYGFTGRLVVEEALRRGHYPVLAGRDIEQLKAMAKPLDLEIMPLSLDDTSSLRAAADSTSLILNAAGPFSATGPKIIDACLETGTAYADISGEFHHVRAVQQLDEQARKASIPLLTGAGFGVTFGDCLARHVVDRLPDATSLRLSVAANNAQITPAVRRTILEVMGKGGYAVENGEWVRRPFAHELWTVKDSSREMEFAAAPMGELAAARASTNVANIVVGRPMAAKTAKRIRMLSPLVQGALSIAPLRNLLGRDSGKPPIAAPEPKEGWRSQLWAEARNARGDRAIARLDTGEGYASTAHAALANIEALFTRKLAGAFTPARAFGAGHVLTIPGVSVTDLDPETLSPLGGQYAAA
jgi:short subunit dehydrogenase-like uncharacterized protein